MSDDETKVESASPPTPLSDLLHGGDSMPPALIDVPPYAADGFGPLPAPDEPAGMPAADPGRGVRVTHLGQRVVQRVTGDGIGTSTPHEVRVPRTMLDDIIVLVDAAHGAVWNESASPAEQDAEMRRTIIALHQIVDSLRVA
jgi:hypothetical protein